MSPQLLDAADKAALKAEIAENLKARGAVLVAHYYVDGDVQDLAEETGGCVSDSLEMARFGHEHEADTLVVAGVRFMGETSKILSPEKRVYHANARRRSVRSTWAVRPTEFEALLSRTSGSDRGRLCEYVR